MVKDDSFWFVIATSLAFIMLILVADREPHPHQKIPLATLSCHANDLTISVGGLRDIGDIEGFCNEIIRLSAEHKGNYSLR